MIDKSKSSLNNLFYQNSKFKNKFLIDPILGNDIDFSSIQLVKKSIIEVDLEKIFTITTTEIFYKDSIFYQKSKITLEPTRLLSYSLEEIKGKSRLLFVLDFCNLTIEIAVKKRQKKFRILILGSEKVFRFKTINYELFQIFLMYLNYFLTNSQSKKDNLLHLSILPNYYKSFYINERTLTHYAKSGDLLLFKGLGYKSAFQRLILRSDYDHIALIVKKDDNMYFLESTYQNGVKLKKWEDFINNKSFSLFNKIVYRELLIDTNCLLERESINDEIVLELDNFIEEVVGKKYLFKLCNYVLCCQKEKTFEKSMEYSKCDSFFCSQLVAAAYKKLKIFDNSISSDKYLPRDFSEKEKLNFNKKFNLGNETNIINFYEL